jgi:integrase
MRPQSLRVYAETLRKWLGWLDANGIDLFDVKPADVEDFASRIRTTGRPPSAGSERRDVVVLRAFHAWGHETRLGLPLVSTAYAPSVRDRNPKPVPDDVWLQLWRSDIDDMERLWLGMGYWLGLRRFEIVTVSPCAVDLNAGTMAFERKGGSTQPIEYRALAEAVVDLPTGVGDGAATWLRIFELEVERRIRLGALWLWWDATGDANLDSNRLNKRLIRSVLPQAGLEPDAVTPHMLRHSCATNLLRAGVPLEVIADQLSHSSTAMTLRYAKTAGQLSKWVQRRSDD